MASNIMTIETGIKTFSLNGTYDVSFNPTDTVFIKSVYGAFEKLEALQDKVALAMSKATGIDAFKIAEKANADMTIEIDSLLGVGCCRAVFGEVSLFSLASGMPLWANLLFAILDEMDSTLTEEQAKRDERLKKYTAKYKVK